MKNPKRIFFTSGQKLFTKSGQETKLIFIEELEGKKYKDGRLQRIFKVQCECGRIKNVGFREIRKGHSINCGQSPCIDAKRKEINEKKRHILNKGQKLFTQHGIETAWTFIEDVEYKKYGKTTRRIIRVQCKCNRIKDVQYNNVTGGHSVCCGFSPCKIPYIKPKSVETSYNALYYAYKKGANDRGLSFDLTMKQFKTFLDKNCYYCNDEPSNIYQILNSKTKEVRAGIPLTYNGIDRKNNKIGYTLENSVTCCETCNRMKMKAGYEFFLSHIKKIYDHCMFTNKFKTI